MEDDDGSCDALSTEPPASVQKSRRPSLHPNLIAAGTDFGGVGTDGAAAGGVLSRGDTIDEVAGNEEGALSVVGGGGAPDGDGDGDGDDGAASTAPSDDSAGSTTPTATKPPVALPATSAATSKPPPPIVAPKKAPPVVAPASAAP